MCLPETSVVYCVIKGRAYLQNNQWTVVKMFTTFGYIPDHQLISRAHMVTQLTIVWIPSNY